MHSPYMQDLYIRVLLCKRKLLYSVFSVFQYVKSSVIGLRRSVRLDKPFCFEPVLLSATLPTDKTSTVQQQNSKLHANFFFVLQARLIFLGCIWGHPSKMNQGNFQRSCKVILDPFQGINALWHIHTPWFYCLLRPSGEATPRKVWDKLLLELCTLYFRMLCCVIFVIVVCVCVCSAVNLDAYGCM